jgi:L-lactate dehydrogenase complex protein LldG
MVAEPEMSEAREAVLAGIRRALAGARDAEVPSPPRDYRQTSDLPRDEILERFVERLSDYHAAISRTSEKDLKDAIGQACSARGATRIVIPAGLSEAWLPAGVEFLRDESLANSELDGSDGVLTACAVAIAETGTIVLDGGLDQGRRAITLLPDYHLCVVRASQIVALVPEAFATLQNGAVDGRPLTFISGPSATSDIELERVEGVHGPRTLEVLMVSDS